MCPDCYDYAAAVLFNAHAADLWRRFTTYLPRHLGRLAGLSVTELRALARIRYVKVVEYQHRGVVHFHAVIRLDPPGEHYQPPAAALTAALWPTGFAPQARPSPCPCSPPRTTRQSFATKQPCKSRSKHASTPRVLADMALAVTGTSGTGRSLSLWRPGFAAPLPLQSWRQQLHGPLVLRVLAGHASFFRQATVTGRPGPNVISQPHSTRTAPQPCTSRSGAVW